MTFTDGSYGCSQRALGADSAFGIWTGADWLCPDSGVTSVQKEIVQKVLTDFPDLRVYAPSHWGNWGFSKSQTWHHKDFVKDNPGDIETAGYAVDFHHKSGEPHPDLAQAWFKYWRDGQFHGLGIGLPSQKKTHLHVDNAKRARPKRARWIEVGPNLKDIVSENNPQKWANMLANVYAQYHYEGDGSEPLAQEGHKNKSSSILPGAVFGAAIGGVMGKSLAGALLGAAGGAAVGKVWDDWWGGRGF